MQTTGAGIFVISGLIISFLGSPSKFTTDGIFGVMMMDVVAVISKAYGLSAVSKRSTWNSGGGMPLPAETSYAVAGLTLLALLAPTR